MDILLAALLMVMGNITAAHPDASFEQLVQAAQQTESGINLDNGQVVQVPDDVQPDAEGFLKVDPAPDTPVIRGLYSTAHSAGGARLNDLIQLLNDTELNSLVIDIKEDRGQITYKSEHPLVLEYGAGTKIIPDIGKLMERLKENEIYPIARIVVFKDTLLAKAKPEWSFKNPDGTIWKNGRGEAFVNPFVQEVWEYNIEVAKEAAKLGFKDIQFDYVRFPEGFEKKADTLKYVKDDRSRVDVVTEFVKYAREQLNPLGVRVSVDIFGYAAAVPAAEGIGQDFNKISKYVDVISPMVYPSHYSTGWYGNKVPDAHPYATIDGAMKDTHKKMTPLEEIGQKPIIRPWIQDFTATWIQGYIKYGKYEIEEQIRALKDNGVDEYLLWDPNNRFTRGVDYK